MFQDDAIRIIAGIFIVTLLIGLVIFLIRRGRATSEGMADNADAAIQDAFDAAREVSNP